MIQKYQQKNVKGKKDKTEDQKKQKSSIMKKLLIKNKIVSILSHQPRKLMKLAKLGNQAYKNLQQHTLLPKLTLKNLYPQIQDLNNKNQIHHEQFQEVNKQLTCSMLHFQHKFSKISQQDEGKILDIQTQKCYSHIPQYFFKDLTQKQVQSILTKNKRQAQNKVFDLIDYADQVQYNINQQVAYKMKVFMDFVFFLQGIAGLVDISCKKIKGSRARSNIIREIIVQKSININILRVKKHNLTECITIISQIKKVKLMEKSLMSLIHAKGKVTIVDLYEQYCKQHAKIKGFCCKKGLCCFGDIRYYIDRNYQDTFHKSLQNYLGQLTKIDKAKLFEILKPTKTIYISTPFENRNSQYQKNVDKTNFCLDQSIQVQDEFQLVVKCNIEQEITNIFQLGIHKCNYSTDNLCIYLKQQFQQLQMKVYSSILQNIEKPKEDLLDNFVKFALNKPTQNSLQLNIDDKILSLNQKSQIINKISSVKFLQIVQLISKKLMDLNGRCFSIINQLMRILKKLQVQQPQKEQIISAYLIQLVIICIHFSNSFLGTFINLRQVKQTQIQLTDKLINVCQSWDDLIQDIQKKYEYVWRKLVFHLNDQKNIKKKSSQIRSSFKELQEFVNLNYSTKQIDDFNQSEDVSQQLIDKTEMKFKMINQIIHAKNQKINFNFYALSKLIISKDLNKRLQNQSWVSISMSSNIQNSLGFMLYGQSYLHKQQSQNQSKNFLSKSLILQKSHMGLKKKSQQSIPPGPQQVFDIQTTQKWIRIQDKHFKLIGVSQYALEVIYLLFIYYDKYQFEEQKYRTNINEKQNLPQKSFQPQKIQLKLLISKTIQIISIIVNKIKYYVNNLKDLQKKVKSFAKFLLLVYVQLDFFKTIILFIMNQKNEINRFHIDKIKQKQFLQMKKNFLREIDECINQIIKKYNSIGYEKIKETIKKLQINPKKLITVPSQTTSEIIAYFSKSLHIIEQIIIDKKQFWKFINCPWVKVYLQKINEQYSQIRKYVLKSNGSGSGTRIEQIEWQDKLDWKSKQLRWLLTAIQNENYGEHIKDISLLQEQLGKMKEGYQHKK